MGRPATSPDIIVEIKTLRAQGKTLEEIEDAMKDDAGVPKISRNTIAKYMKQWSDLDAAFQWQNLESYGLPWEGSDFLLGMWHFLLRYAHFGQEHPYLPTARLMQWCWRVHQAFPECPLRYPASFVIWEIAQRFVQREQRHELLGQPLNTDDLMAFLAYKPWANAENLKAYRSAISKMLIRAVEKEGIEGLERVKEIALEDGPYGEPSDNLLRFIAWALSEASTKGGEVHV